MESGTDGVDTTFFQKVHINILAWHFWRSCRLDPSFIAETSFVKAPLNSRVPSHSHTTPRTHGKGKSREGSLENVSLDIQESLILEDLLFVLMVSVPLASIGRAYGIRTGDRRDVRYFPSRLFD